MTIPTPKCDELYTERELAQMLYASELEAELTKIAAASRKLILAQLRPAHARARAILQASRDLAQLIDKYDDGRDPETSEVASDPRSTSGVGGETSATTPRTRRPRTASANPQ